LLEQNFRQKCGELDLVFQDGKAIVFVEVRYRSSNRWGDGLASVTKAKQRRLIRAASSWLKRNAAYARAPCRFDVVSVSGPESAPKLKWARNAFEAH
jgi:putative endonuclease